MKCLIVFAIVCVVALAQRDPIEGIRDDEVRAILRAYPGITVEECTTKCDAVYALDVPQEDEVTDRDCARECRIQLHGEGTTSRA